jgi:hypothetical protein
MKSAKRNAGILSNFLLSIDERNLLFIQVEDSGLKFS